MQTFQATAMELKIIPFSVFDRPTTFRIVNEEGVMIAKVNGKENVPICAEMVKAFNEKDTLVVLRSLCRNRLVEILKALKGDGHFNISVRHALGKGKEEEVVSMLKDQLKDAPLALVGIIGGEAVQILQHI